VKICHNLILGWWPVAREDHGSRGKGGTQAEYLECPERRVMRVAVSPATKTTGVT